MSDGHFSHAGAYRVDPKTEFYRAQEEQRAEDERVRRSTHWFALRLAGQTFDSIEQLRAVCVGLAETLYITVDDDTARVVNRSVTALWLARIEYALLREPRVLATVTEDPHTVTFVAA